MSTPTHRLSQRLGSETAVKLEGQHGKDVMLVTWKMNRCGLLEQVCPVKETLFVDSM